ncbi:cell division topological specificity factor MinE [Undibacterium cyanobacteriorum]|uniref:Cell division topological specificity factor n=1 Tax=Undibacterium cyanobacteriorum TaxID=3073561 RepID=A0ABY9RKG5_9BURK|nr:cell division topological specificity factor MinE [Undibacterium sp. 20NA77.5]WMW81174.1 cell division topological specificity factor MinE [Undibacterium sp. 20NA77.5]
MDLLSFLFNNKPKSASTAKERLRIIIESERNGGREGNDFLPALRQELIAVISKYTKVNPDDIKVSLDKQGNLEVLDVNVILPDVDSRT